MTLLEHVGMAIFYVLIGIVVGLGFVLVIEVIYPDQCRPIYGFLSNL